MEPIFIIAGVVIVFLLILLVVFWNDLFSPTVIVVDDKPKSNLQNVNLLPDGLPPNPNLTTDLQQQVELKKQILELEKQKADIAAAEVKRLSAIAAETKRLADIETKRLADIEAARPKFLNTRVLGCYAHKNVPLPINAGSKLPADCANLAKSKGFQMYAMHAPNWSSVRGGAECFYGKDYDYSASVPATVECWNNLGSAGAAAESDTVYSWD